MAFDIKLDTFRIEIIMDAYLLQAKIKPLGDLIIFLNDQNRTVLPLEEIEMFPLATDRQVKGVQQTKMSVNKHLITTLGLINADEVARVQMLKSSRQIVCYTDRFAIRGNLHINPDTPDEDMFDDSRDFFPMSDVSLFPLRPAPSNLTNKIPLLLVNRLAIRAYHKQ